MIGGYNEKVHLLRAKHGITWEELGRRMTAARRKRLGPDAPEVGRQGAYAASKSQNPQATTIHDVAAAFGVPVEYFFEGGGKAEPPEPTIL